jgi:HAD superfamily hydrolase (TIGR01509 family)
MHLPHPQRLAVLFDMDGTLIDTESTGALSWDHAGDDLGVEVPDTVKRAMVGRTMPDIIGMVGEAMPGVDVHHLFSRANYHYHRLLEENPPPVKHGALEILRQLEAWGIPRAVATSSRASQAEDKLTQTGLRAYFDVIVAGDQIRRGKPDPEIFLTAAERLGVPIADCVAFEDSGPGIESASRAGAYAVLIPEHPPADPLWAAFAHRILGSLHEGIALIVDLRGGRG